MFLLNIALCTICSCAREVSNIMLVTVNNDVQNYVL